MLEFIRGGFALNQAWFQTKFPALNQAFFLALNRVVLSQTRSFILLQPSLGRILLYPGFLGSITGVPNTGIQVSFEVPLP